MCQSKSPGHHDGRSHHQGSKPIRPRSLVRGVVSPDLQPTRRQVLGRLTTAGLVSAAGGLPLGSLVKAIADDNQPPPPGQARATLFEFKKIADGIYGAIAKPTAMLNCNAAVIVNRDHILVVDTHSKPSAAKALIRQIRDEITQLPVRYVVDSHLHGDHATGNEAYPEVFGGGVEVISSVKTREWMEKLGLSRLKESIDYVPIQVAELRSKLEASKDESERAILRAHIEGLEEYKKEMTPPRVSLPSMTLSGAWSSTAAAVRSIFSSWVARTRLVTLSPLFPRSA
jgi:hypothetical protein